MAFAVRPEESLRKGIRRIARREMEEIRAHVTKTANGSRDAAVHEARKCCKKLRALLRLVRPAISARTYRDENTAFRDAARPLTAVRDAKVLDGNSGQARPALCQARARSALRPHPQRADGLSTRGAHARPRQGAGLRHGEDCRAGRLSARGRLGVICRIIWRTFFSAIWRVGDRERNLLSFRMMF